MFTREKQNRNQKQGDASNLSNVFRLLTDRNIYIQHMTTFKISSLSLQQGEEQYRHSMV